MQKLLELYKQWRGQEPANVQQLAGSGSNRIYIRLTDSDGKSVIGVIGTSRDEDHAFIYLTEHFTRRKLPVPRILAQSDDQLRYIQTDLGSTSLFDAIRGGREAGVIDPAKVARVALENAASIAGMFLTTECLIVDKPEKEPAMPMGGAPGMGGMM